MASHYGQIVRIHCTLEGEGNGLITSKSYTDPTLYCQSYNHADTIPNYRESLFEILPMSSFDINDELENAPENKRESLEPRAKTERQQFETLIAQKRGEKILFGAQVVFKHYDSGFFITGCFECARSGIGAFKIYLSPVLSSKIIFSLQSFRTYEKDGDQITLGAPIKIYHDLTHCYVSFQTQNIFLDKELPPSSAIEEDKMLLIRPAVKTPTGIRYELINENIPKRVWRLQEHEKYWPGKPKTLITNHDLVYFLHTQDNKYLVPRLNSNGVYLKKIKDDEGRGDFYDGIWEIQQEIVDPERMARYGSKNKRLTRGHENVDQKKRLIVRHLTSGRVLISNSYAKQPLCVFYEDGFQERQVIMTYKCTNLEDNSLVNFESQGFFIDTYSKPAELENGEEGVLAHSMQFIQFERDDEKIQSIRNAYEINFEKCDLTMKEEMNEHGFRVYKFPEEFKKQLLLVLSSQELLNKFTNFMAVPDESYILEYINFTLLNDITNLLKHLIGFIYNCNYDQIKVLGSTPVAQRQKIFGQLGMVQLITSMLYQIDARSEMLYSKLSFNRKSEYNRIRNIYELGYEILESIAKNNKVLKLLISLYLRNYLQQMLKGMNKVVYKSLQVVLEDNYMAIEKLVQRDYLKKLILSFNKLEPDPEDLKFLSTLCICQGRAVQENQNLVEEKFYEVGVGSGKLDPPDSDKFKFREDHQVMQIGSTIPGTGNPRYRTLPQLYKECEEELQDAEESKKDKGHWRYFIEYLNLLADLCMHRNQIAQKYVSDILPLQKLVAFLEQPIVKEKGLYQPFIRLAHYAYIQNSNYDQISRISKAKYWNDNSVVFDIPRANKPVHESLNQIMELIMRYIQKINRPRESQEVEEPIELDPNNIEQLRNVYTFLELLKSTLNLGFWKSIENLKEMVPSMLRILKFDKGYADREYQLAVQNKSEEEKVMDQAIFKRKIYDRTKYKLTLNKPEINMLVRCKILAAQILDIILDNENNIRVSEITKLFKDILQMNLDLSEFDITEESQAELDLKLRDYKEYHKFKPDNEKEMNMLNERIWIKKLNEMLNNRDIFSKVNKDQLNPMLILLEISNYRNETLSNYCLALLSRIYGQRKQILQNFSNIIIVSKGSLLELSRRAEETRGKLLALASYNILNVTLGTTPKMWDNSSKEIVSVIQELAYLTIKMKKNDKQNPMTLYEYESLYPYAPIEDQKNYQQRALSIITEKDETNTLHQNLIKSQDHHLILFEFIKIMEELPQSDLAAKVLHAAYNFLTVLVWNNKQNKESMEYFLKRAIVHLRYNIGCIDFFREMYSNNKKLVKSESDLSQLVDLVVSTANKLQMSSYYKSKLIDFLRVLVIFDDKGEQKNQNIVMEVISRYQVSSSNRIVFISNPKYWSVTPEQMGNWVATYKQAYEKSCTFKVDLKMSPELSYIASFFQIFGALIENENTINIGKCTNMHPYDWLVDLITKARPCWPVVRYLRSYINKLYYAESREIQTQQYEIFVNREIENISEELLEIAKLRENCPQYGKIKIQNPVRYSYIASYVFLTLEEILISLRSMFGSAQFVGYFSVLVGQSKDSKPVFQEKLLNILETMGYLMVRLDGRYINKFMEEVRDLIRDIVLASFPLDVLVHFDRKNKAYIAQLAKAQQDQFGGGEDVPFKKRYVFGEHKSFWRQLIDWYSFDKQERGRIKMINEIELKEDRDRRQQNSQETDQQKQKQYRINNICLGKIQRKIKDKRLRAASNKEQDQEGEKAQKADGDEPVKNDNIIIPKNLITSKSKHFKLKNEPELTSEKENILVNARRRKLLRFIAVNKSFEDFKLEEFYEFSEQLALVDSYSLQKYELTIIGASDIVRAFVEMNDNNPNFLREDLKLCLLSLLTNFITRNNPDKYKLKPVDKWESADWLEYKKPIEEAQNFLNSCNCAKLICSFIKYNLENSLEMTNKLFLFSVAFLLGGNRSCQNSFMELFKKDDKNIIFAQIQKLIKRSNVRITLSASSKSQANQIRTSHSDTYDFFDENEYIMERKFGYEEETSEEQKLFNQLISALSRAYRYLQLLCESNNAEMKDYIRQQVDEDGKVKGNNFDYIEITNAELRRLFKVLDPSIVHLPLSLIHFLNQVTQLPCKENQVTLCKGTFFEDICLFQNTSKDRPRTEFEKQMLLCIYNKSIDIALSCLEGNQEKIYEDLGTKLEVGFLVNLIESNLELIDEYRQGFRMFEKMLSEAQTHEDKVIQILKIVQVVCKLEAWGKSQKFNNFQKALSDQMKPIVRLLRQNLLCIQVDNGGIQSVYFAYHPVYKYLSSSTKDKIMFSINRETSRDKLVGLLKTGDEISNEVDYNYALDHLQLIWPFLTISITPERIGLLRQFSQLISVLICILLIFWARVFYYPDEEYVEYALGKKKFIMSVLSAAQFFCTFLYISMWLTNRTYLAVCKYEQDSQSPQDGDEETEIVISSVENKTVGQKLLQRFRMLKNIYCLYKYEDDFVSVMLFFMASILGTFYKIEYYSLHLFDLVGQIPLLTNVFKAVTQNISLLSIVSLLGISFIGIFSVFSFGSYINSLYEEEVPKEHCQSVIECIMKLYLSEEINNDVSTFNPFRFGFDLLYVVFMDLLFGNIISGIMIDTFASLRDTKQSIDADKKGVCFICGITRQTLEKSSMTLEEHYTGQHHLLWNYVFYLYYLKHKAKINETYTGLEYIITSKIQSEDVSWIPTQQDEGPNVQAQLEQLEIKANRCYEMVKKLPAGMVVE